MTSPAVLPDPQPAVSFKNILLATDFSAASEKGFSYAVAMARRHGAKIDLVHVIPSESVSFAPAPSAEQQRYEEERQLESLASRSELNQIPHEAILRAGSVGSVLSSLIREQEIDLVILATHGRSGLKKLVLGSVAEEVVRRAECPVLTVGPHIDTTLGTSGRFSRILFATDFHSASAKALDYALFLANEPETKLILLHVMPPTALPGPGPSFHDEQAINAWQANVRASITEKMQKLLPPAVRLGSEPDYVVSFDFIGDGIVKEAAARKADLIIAGAKRLAFVKAFAHSLGGVSYEVIRRAKCPVLTVSA
jgi:nucleotide-binding universal stress UspA family protein